MKNPCIAIDVAKESSHVQGFYSLNDYESQAKEIFHNHEGFSYVSELIKAIADKTSKEVIVVYEATGVYDKSLQRFLMDNGIRHVKINPLVSARYRKNNLRAIKTDKKDCANIAKVYFNEHLEYHLEESDYYKELRLLNRYYEVNLDHLRKYKVNFHESLDIVWPGYNKLFTNLFTELPLKIIENYKHPDLLKKVRLKTLSKFIQKNSSHRETWSDNKATVLLQYANDVQSGCNDSDVNVRILVDKIESITYSINKTEKILEEIIDITKDSVEFKVIRSIPGIGDNLASRLVAEIGEITRFSNSKQLVAYSGLDPQVYESGNYKGKWSISKKGNKRLRRLLYLAARCSLRSNIDSNSIKDYYKRKVQQGKTHNVVLIACCNKLLRVIYTMCISGSLYEYII